MDELETSQVGQKTTIWKKRYIEKQMKKKYFFERLGATEQKC